MARFVSCGTEASSANNATCPIRELATIHGMSRISMIAAVMLAIAQLGAQTFLVDQTNGSGAC